MNKNVFLNKDYIYQIDILRAILAYWVLFDHFLGFFKFKINDLIFPLTVVRAGWLAVDIFIMISGFVIFHLVFSLKSQFNVKNFIKDRFFRLFPLFFLSSIITTITVIVLFDYLPNVYKKTYTDLFSSFFQHLMVNITMLHGILPNNILSNSSWGFNPVSWSISLEWQFYLSIPFILYILKKRTTFRFLIFISLGIFLMFINEDMGKRTFQSFLTNKIQYFYLGMISYLIYQSSFKKGYKLILVLVTSFLLVILIEFFFNIKSIYQLNAYFIPLFLWFLFMICLIYDTSDYKKSKIKSFFVSQGKKSYSIYMNHIAVLIILSSIFNNINNIFFLILLGLFSITIVSYLSDITYNKIEKNFYKFKRE